LSSWVTSSAGPIAQTGALLDSAQNAFVNGVRVVAVVGAVLYVLGGLLVIVKLRAVPSFSQQAAPPAEPEQAGVANAESAS
jgi:DHA2 family multidrug resistance protein-like MFS transporter